MPASSTVVSAVSASRIYLIGLLEFAALGPIITAVTVSLPAKVLEIAPDTKESSLGLVIASGALAALIANPVFGHLSDRTRSHFGRRRPWIVASAAVGGFGSVLVLLAPTPGWLAAGWVLGQMGYNAMTAALSAMFADQIPVLQQATASGVFGAFGFLSVIPAMALAMLFAGHLSVLVLGMPLLTVGLVLIISPFVPDPCQDSAARRSGPANTVSALIGPFRAPGFALIWVQRCVMQFGYTIVATLSLYCLLDRLDMDRVSAVSTLAIVTLCSSVLNALAALARGHLASRRGNYGPFL